MARQTTPEQRTDFYRRHVCGESYAQIAASSGVSLECVRYWCRKQKHGLGVHTRYHIPRRGALSQFDPVVRQAMLALREEHPGWGPISLHLNLEKDSQLQGLPLPAPSSLGRCLHEYPQYRRQGKKVKRPAIDPPTHTHQRWQIDFKVDIHLQDGQTVQLHDVYDPFSGAHIGSCLYPSAAGARGVLEADVRTTLLGCFSEWGTCPEEVQTDGESALIGKPQDALPSHFSLWLAGFGIQHRVIPPGKPTCNGGVERDHRTTMDYAITGQQHLPLPKLQEQLDQARWDLNAGYPSQAQGCGGQPPLQAHPELLTPRRSYHPDLQRSLFQLEGVEARLAQLAVERKVNKTGQISLGGQHEYYFVGRSYAGQMVQVGFDPKSHCFVAYQVEQADQRCEIKRWPARGLTVDDFLDPPLTPARPIPLQLPLLLDFSGVNC